MSKKRKKKGETYRLKKVFYRDYKVTLSVLYCIR